MNLLKLLTSFFLISVLFPALSIGQSALGNLDLQPETVSPTMLKLLNTKNNGPSNSFKGPNDLLIAQRGDVWTNNTWNTNDSTDYYYDNNDRLAERITKVLNSSNTWVNDRRTTYSYDANGYENLVLTQNWDGANWINVSHVIKENKSTGIDTLYLAQNWDGSNWINNFQWVSHENTMDSTLVAFRQDWDGSSWVNAFYNTFYNFYNNSYAYLTAVEQQQWNTTTAVWDNFLRITYIYGSNNEELSSMQYDWDGSSWVLAYRSMNTYDSILNWLGFVREKLDGTGWVNFSQYTLDYDANNNQILSKYELWEMNNWRPSFESLYQYDANDNRTEAIARYWNGSSLENSSRTTSYYQIVSSISTPELAYPIQLFPNPASSLLTVDLGNNNIESGQLKIYNLQGQLLRIQPIKDSQQQSFELSDLSAGTYILQVVTDDRQSAKTFVVGK